MLWVELTLFRVEHAYDCGALMFLISASVCLSDHKSDRMQHFHHSSGLKKLIIH